MAMVVVPIMAVAGCTLGCLNLVSEFERKCGTIYSPHILYHLKMQKIVLNSKTTKRLCQKEIEPQIIEIPAQQFTMEMIPQQPGTNININNNMFQAAPNPPQTQIVTQQI